MKDLHGKNVKSLVKSQKHCGLVYMYLYMYIFIIIYFESITIDYCIYIIWSSSPTPVPPVSPLFPLKFMASSLIIMWYTCYTRTHTHPLLSTFSGMLVCTCVYDWYFKLYSLSGGMSQKKKLCFSLRSHWLPAPLHFRMQLWEISPIPVGMPSGTVIIQAMVKQSYC